MHNEKEYINYCGIRDNNFKYRIICSTTELKSGVVFGLQAGISGFQGQPDCAPGTTTYQAGFIGGATIGYDYAVTPTVAVGIESGFNYSPQTYKQEFSAGGLTSKIDTMNISLLVTAKYLTPINVTVFGKAGYSWNRYKISSDAPDGSVTYNTFSPMVAAGFGYQLQNFHFFGQYTHTFGKDLDNLGGKNTISTNTVTAGVTYSLPLSF